MQNDNCIIQVFSKNPVPGRVKTRLIPLLGPHEACRLQEIMFERLLNEVTKLNHRAEIWTDLLPFHPLMIHSGFPLLLQSGGNVGEKMLDAITDGLARAEKVILVGSDLPPLDWSYIDSAIKALERCDVVFGPTEDGGFGLIGTTISCTEMFDGVRWSSISVFRDIINNFSEHSISPECLPLIWDVDTPDDLDRFFEFTQLHFSDLR